MPYPWDGFSLDVEEVPSPVRSTDFFQALCLVDGIYAGDSLDPFIPVLWDRHQWQYVALVMGPSQKMILDRIFVGNSARKYRRHTYRDRGFNLKVDLPLLSEGSLVEIRSGAEPDFYEEVYQRIYRKDAGGWVHVAYRQEDRVGLVHPSISYGSSVKKYEYQRFYPWCLILGIELTEKSNYL
jgi:hypothetical protein